jgi:hypothetical protein
MTIKNTIADRDLEALQAAIAVFVAGQAGYDQARQAWNLAVDQRPSVQRVEIGPHDHLVLHISCRRRQAVTPPASDGDVARLFLLAGWDFGSARERTKRKRECRPVRPGLHRDGAVVSMRDASDNR